MTVTVTDCSAVESNSDHGVSISELKMSTNLKMHLKPSVPMYDRTYDNNGIIFFNSPFFMINDECTDWFVDFFSMIKLHLNVLNNVSPH